MAQTASACCAQLFCRKRCLCLEPLALRTKRYHVRLVYMNGLTQEQFPHLHMQLADGCRDMLSQLLLQILQDFVVEGHQLWQRGGDTFGTGDQASQSLQQGSAMSATCAWARGADKR